MRTAPGDDIEAEDPPVVAVDEAAVAIGVDVGLLVDPQPAYLT